MSTFYKTANLILEESGPEARYELITPNKYSRVYQEVNTKGENKNVGYILNLIEEGGLTVAGMRIIDRESKEAKDIKSNWEKVYLMAGSYILKHDRFARNKRFAETIINDHAARYITHTLKDLKLKASEKKWILNHDYWIEHVETFKDYTSKETSDTFKDFMNEL
jgi:hypothetical protein